MVYATGDELEDDLQGLIDSIGGKEAAEKRLDEMFRRLDASYGDEWFASGNEPSFQIPWIYNWAGAPYKAQQVIRRILNEQYSSRVNGLPGNDDLGSMGAWYVFASIGLFPEIPGVGGFSVNSPVFRKIVLHLPEGDVIIKGGDEKKEYIHSLSLDGKKMEGTWIDWSDLYRGATLEYKLSGKPDKTWGTRIAPPSYGK